MEGGKQVKLKGGKSMYTYRTLSEENFHLFMEAWRLEDGGKWEDGFGWNFTLGQGWGHLYA